MPAIGAIEVFVFRQGQFVGSRMFSPDRLVTIGRASDQGLRLDDEEVSSRHATLRVVDGHVVISDAGSRNGIYVNGRKVPNAKVSSFDEILIGGCRLKIEVVGGMGHAVDFGGAPDVERTRVSGVPLPAGTQPGRPATSPYAPKVGGPEPPVGTGTTPFIRAVSELPPSAAPASRAPEPAAPPRSAAPSGGGRGPAAPPQFVDEDARTASIEFAPPVAPDSASASGTYWDFDEEGATQPGRSLRDLGPTEDSQAAQGTRTFASPGATGQSDLVIVDAAMAAVPVAMPTPATALPPRPAEPVPAPPRPARPHPAKPVPTPPADSPGTTAPAVPAKMRSEPRPAPEAPAPPPGGKTGAPVQPGVSPYAPTPRIDTDAVLASETPADGIAGTVDTLETAPAAMPPRLNFEDDEELEEDEIEERDWVEPFSLLENILRDHSKDATSGEPQAILEMIRYRDRRVLDLVRIHRGEDFDSFGATGEEVTGRFRLVKLHKDGRAQLFFTEATQGSVVLGGVTTPLSDLCVDDRLHNKRKRIFTVMLCEGDYAQVLLESGGGFLMRFSHPPVPPPHTFGSDFSTQDAIFMGAGLGAILLIMIGLWGIQAIAGPSEIKLQEEELTFAQVSLKEAQLLKPDEPKKVDPPPEPPAGAEMPQLEKIKTVARQSPRRVSRAAASPGPPGPPQPAKPAGVLSALNDLRPAADSGDNALRAAVSNIAAVRVPGGTSSAFQVSGTFSKLPGGEVRLATGGGGGGGRGRETRVGAELFRGAKGAKLGGLTGGGGRGRIRGAVKSAGRPVTRGGILDAAAVQRVVTQHLAAVQGCYERQLLKDPGLQGKITFDWDVAPSGSVSSARMVSSTMGAGGSSVAACIVSEIRRWKFPKPIGGTASVRYPFIFRMSGF
jgi:hypothetical protein